MLAITALRQRCHRRCTLGWDCGGRRWVGRSRRHEDVHRLNAVVGSSFFTVMETVPSSKMQPGCVSVPVAQPSCVLLSVISHIAVEPHQGRSLDAEFRPKSLNLVPCSPSYVPTLIHLHLGPKRVPVAASPLFSSGTGADGTNAEHFISPVVSWRWVWNS